MGGGIALGPGQQQPPSERRRGDQMFGVTTVGTTQGPPGQRRPVPHRGQGRSRSRSTHPCLLGPPRSTDSFLTKPKHLGLLLRKWLGTGDISSKLEWPQHTSSSPTVIFWADVFPQIKGPVCGPQCDLRGSQGQTAADEWIVNQNTAENKFHVKHIHYPNVHYLSGGCLPE